MGEQRRGTTRGKRLIASDVAGIFGNGARCTTVDVDFLTITRRRLYALFRTFIKNLIPPTTPRQDAVARRAFEGNLTGSRRKLDGPRRDEQVGARCRLTFRAHC